MKLYLAGPMAGHQNENFRAFFVAAALLRFRGHEIVSPAEMDIDSMVSVWDSVDQRIMNTDRVSRAERMQRDIVALAGCEGIVMLPGWRDSLGANDEHYVAKEVFGLPVFLYDSVLEDILPEATS